MQSIKHLDKVVYLSLVFGLLGCNATPTVNPSVEDLSQPLTTAPIDLAKEMREISSYYRMFNEAVTLQEASQALTLLSQATERSGYVYPNKILASEAEKMAYRKDLERMQSIIKQTQILLQENQLAEAKIYAQRLNAIKDEAHARYR